ncbi:hypothetical protein WA026_015150 [Henosepilachna vigintioctopunctata]|uniref:Uncharacterized protein n=1 Tax=Henosepilachna vigintioctopunctata TaxID=420089 RepID=A0AAW1TKU2_9CUCU
MYLKSQNIVDSFINSHGSIKINNQRIHARKLITPTTRLVLSNVCPTIPHTILKNEIEKIGLEILSPMTFLKISSTLPQFSHIYSFRRQIFINTPETQIPESTYTYNTTYRIYLSLYSMVCYNCKQHTAVNFKTLPNSQTTSSTASGQQITNN